jgi:hypothetical protein
LTDLLLREFSESSRLKLTVLESVLGKLGMKEGILKGESRPTVHVWPLNTALVIDCGEYCIGPAGMGYTRDDAVNRLFQQVFGLYGNPGGMNGEPREWLQTVVIPTGGKLGSKEKAV